MKKSAVIMTVCTLIGAWACNNSVKNVPQAVKTALSNKYTTSGKITWEKENGNYEANWGGQSGEDTAVQYTPAGEFVEMELSIPPNDLPQQAGGYVKSNYPDQSIKEAVKATKANGEVNYEATVGGKNLIFDANGNFINIESGAD